MRLPALFVTLADWLRGWLFSGFGWLAPRLQPDRLVAHGLRAGARHPRHDLGRARLRPVRSSRSRSARRVERAAAAVVLVAVWGVGAAAAGRRGRSRSASS